MRVALIAALVLMPTAAFSQGIEANGWTLTNPTISGPMLGTEGSAPATPASGKVLLYPKSGAPGEWCSKDDAGVETCMSAGGGGGGAPNSSKPVIRLDNLVQTLDKLDGWG